jgi:hypothetical protein
MEPSAPAETLKVREVAAGTTWAWAETAARKPAKQKNAKIDRFMSLINIHFP